jgi:hypothetical protein
MCSDPNAIGNDYQRYLLGVLRDHLPLAKCRSSYTCTADIAKAMPRSNTQVLPGENPRCDFFKT